jgi:hypothetical protein
MHTKANDECALHSENDISEVIRISMTEQQEYYIHLSTCINQLNHAWTTLRLVKNTKDNPLTGPAFCYGLIEYSRAYTQSHGVIKENENSKQMGSI